MKFILVIGFIIFIVLGTVFAGLIGFVVTFIMVLVISNMFTRIEKEKIEKTRHEETLRAIEESKND